MTLNTQYPCFFTVFFFFYILFSAYSGFNNEIYAAEQKKNKQTYTDISLKSTEESSSAEKAKKGIRAGKHSRKIKKYDGLIKKYAAIYSVNPNIIKALIMRESEFNPYAVGRYGEIGLMQITREAVKDWADAHNTRSPSRRTLFYPSVNIEIGTWYLCRAMNYWKKYTSNYLVVALCEYNAGRKGVRRKVAIYKNGKIVIFNRRLYRYISSVLDYYRYFNN